MNAETYLSESVEFWLWLVIIVFIILSFIAFTLHFFTNAQYRHKIEEFGHPFMIAQLTTAG